MNITLRIALKYLTTFRFNHFITYITIISIIGIVIGVAALIIVISIFNGFAEFTENQLQSYDPHLRIIPKSGVWLNYEEVLGKLETIPEITHSYPVIKGRVIISKDKSLKSITLNCLKLKDFAKLEGFKKAKIYGKLNIHPQGRKLNLLVGAMVADDLRILPDDTVRLMSLNMIERSLVSLSYSPGLEAQISGIFQSNNIEYDNDFAFIDFESGKYILNPPPKSASVVDIELFDGKKTSEIQKQIEQLFPNLKVETWYDLHKELYNIMKLEQLGVFVVLSLIILIAVFNVLASLAMTVVEKRQDIGILMSMGATPSMIRKIYLYIGSIIGLFSTILGTIIGLVMCYGQINFGWIKLSTTKFLISTLPVSVYYSDVLLIFAFSVIISFLATIYPAKRAADMVIIEAIRTE
ncbi:MAG: ABC transporter permease [Candidatus Kapabacteria bacterium]|nr:ABC transporter permease [Candidatus Kapabacteria bacterium]